MIGLARRNVNIISPNIVLQMLIVSEVRECRALWNDRHIVSVTVTSHFTVSSLFNAIIEFSLRSDFHFHSKVSRRQWAMSLQTNSTLSFRLDEMKTARKKKLSFGLASCVETLAFFSIFLLLLCWPWNVANEKTIKCVTKSQPISRYSSMKYFTIDEWTFRNREKKLRKYLIWF